VSLRAHRDNQPNGYRHPCASKVATKVCLTCSAQVAAADAELICLCVLIDIWNTTR
jgi:hypothetical protein